MLLRKFCALILLTFALPLWAAPNTTVAYELRTTGNDNNGGGFDSHVTSPGTDYSQQDSPQITYSDLVIGATNTQLTSSAHAFSSVSPGNMVHVTGGTGFTTGWYEVLSVSGSTATMDRAVGTASSTGGTGYLGGGFATWAGENTAVGTFLAGNVCWVKSGTYTVTARFNVTQCNYVGYQTTHGDAPTGSSRPLITIATSSTDLILFASSNGIGFANLAFSNTAATRARGMICNSSPTVSLVNVSMTGFSNAINCTSSTTSIGALQMTKVEFSGSTSDAVSLFTGTSIVVRGAYFHGNSGSALNFSDTFGTASTFDISNVIMAGGSHCINDPSGKNGFRTTVMHNVTCYGASSDGIVWAADSNTSTTNSYYPNIENVVSYGNSGYGFVGPISSSADPLAGGGMCDCDIIAYGNNTSGNTSNWYTSVTTATPITLTANPFTNTSTGDYSLNSTAGGGALLRAAGFPGVFPGGTTTGYLDVGAVQSQASSGSSGSSYAWSK